MLSHIVIESHDAAFPRIVANASWANASLVLSLWFRLVAATVSKAFVAGLLTVGFLLASAQAEEPADTDAVNALPPATVECGQSTFWEVSSRCLSSCPSLDGEVANFRVTKCVDGQWSSTHVDDLIEYCRSQPNHQLVVYVHGNWMDASGARTRELTIFRTLQRYAKRNVTFISYTWPAEKQQGFARDVWAKKDRVDADSFYLANLIDRLECPQPTGLLGFSFGARMLVGSLHMLAGGRLGGRELPATTTRCYNLTMLAPAFDRTALAPCGEYDQALYAVNQVVNLYNSRDRVLRRFHFFDSKRPTAAGFAGLVLPYRNGDRVDARADRALVASESILQFDCQSIGRAHAELDYFRCNAIIPAINNILAQ